MTIVYYIKRSLLPRIIRIIIIITIAKALIQYCENYCLSLSDDTVQFANTKFQSSLTTVSSKIATLMKDFIIQKNELYIRVEHTNTAAITMYTQLG